MSKKYLVVASLACLIALVFNFQLALAHESVTVGDYTIEVGWMNEPPVVGQQNAVVVNVSSTSGGDEKPVDDVSGLTVTISYGGQSKTLTLQPLGEDTPGHFIAPILPAVPGKYTIILGGKLGDNDVNNVEVQPEEVQPADTLQFPSAVSSQQGTDLAIINWLLYISLLIGLIALWLAILALRKAG